MGRKIKFSAQMPCSDTAEELEERVRKAKLSQRAKQVMSELLIRGYANGVVVRDHKDGDAPTIGQIRRMAYEEYVVGEVGKLRTKDRELALDLSLFCYSEGHRAQEKIPAYFRKLEAAIGAKTEESIFDCAKK